MAKAVYVCSTEAGAGKTMFAISLARRLQVEGFTVGYMKPLTVIEENEAIENSDAGFAKWTLGLDGTFEQLAPIRRTSIEASTDSPSTTLARIKSTFDTLSRNKQVIIIEGSTSLSDGTMFGITDVDIVKALNAQAVLVARYRPDILINHIAQAKQSLDGMLHGVIVNNVPTTQTRATNTTITALKTEDNETTIMGVLPQLRSLLAVDVQSVISRLGGKVVCCTDQTDRMIENVAIGTIGHEDAPSYFATKANTLVIAAGGRPDIHLAALSGTTSCLLLTGDKTPDPYVVSRAEEVHVPVVLAQGETSSIVEQIGELIDGIRFRQKGKIESAENLLIDHLDWPDFDARLGLSTQAD